MALKPVIYIDYGNFPQAGLLALDGSLAASPTNLISESQTFTKNTGH